ncbi:hypothetical protein C5D25_00840 [Rathayibacter sp. AY1D7]|nr:hypothetical protein C5D25_00840 [Rathayibacter sp. AY1D7]
MHVDVAAHRHAVELEIQLPLDDRHGQRVAALEYRDRGIQKPLIEALHGDLLELVDALAGPRRDLTGRLTTWIEVGAPDAERLHFGSRLADRTTVYTHRNPDKVIAAWSGKRVHQLEQITVQSFDQGFLDAAVAVLERRNTLTVSVVEGQLYLEFNSVTMSSDIHVHQPG